MLYLCFVFRYSEMTVVLSFVHENFIYLINVIGRLMNFIIVLPL